MAYEKPVVFRVNGSVPLEINAEVDNYAALAGMSKSQFIGLLVQFGLKAWIRTYSPEKLFTAEDWKKIMKIGEEVNS